MCRWQMHHTEWRVLNVFRYKPLMFPLSIYRASTYTHNSLRSPEDPVGLFEYMTHANPFRLYYVSVWN